MANKYLVWKDANCNGVNPEWIDMDGKSFYAFKNEPANKHRHFVRLRNDVCEEADVIVIEANKEQYDEWNREDSARYRREQDKQEYPYQIVSLEENAGELHELTFNEVVADESVNVEQEAIGNLQSEFVREIVMALPYEDRQIIELMFLGAKPLSERRVAKILGISNDTLHYRKIRIFEKIKNFFKQN